MSPRIGYLKTVQTIQRCDTLFPTWDIIHPLKTVPETAMNYPYGIPEGLVISLRATWASPESTVLPTIFLYAITVRPRRCGQPRLIRLVQSPPRLLRLRRHLSWKTAIIAQSSAVTVMEQLRRMPPCRLFIPMRCG